MLQTLRVQEDERTRLYRGDPDAWEAFYLRMYPLLLSYAQRRLSGHDDAKEAVAEAMARLVATLTRAQDRSSSPEAWVFGILRHIVTDGQRHMYRRQRYQHEYPLVVDEPWVALVETEERESMRRAFAQLSPKEQEVLELRVIARLSSEETALLLQLSPGAVRMAQARALRRLRRFHEREGQ